MFLIIATTGMASALEPISTTTPHRLLATINGNPRMGVSYTELGNVAKKTICRTSRPTSVAHTMVTISAVTPPPSSSNGHSRTIPSGRDSRWEQLANLTQDTGWPYQSIQPMALYSWFVGQSLETDGKWPYGKSIVKCDITMRYNRKHCCR